MSSYDEAREAAQKCASHYTHLGMLTNGDAGATVSEMVDDILSAFLAKLSETHAVVPREPTVDVLNAILRSAVSEIAVMHATGRINSMEAQTRQEAAEREAHRIYRVITSTAPATQPDTPAK